MGEHGRVVPVGVGITRPCRRAVVSLCRRRRGRRLLRRPHAVARGRRRRRRPRGHGKRGDM